MQPPAGPSPSELWLQQRFADYYKRHSPELPERFGKREYGFIFFGSKGMLRHFGFKTRTDFESFHARRAPAHSYYSTAFYDQPDAPTMKEKGWKAAELIFDLDADHVPGAEKLPYDQQLDRVKHHFRRLVDDFILNDFGFEEKDLLLTFSGGRGYHCHVLSPRALELTSQERREIVDYITGTGLEVERFLRVETVTDGRSSQFKRSRTPMRMARAGDPGWGSRLNAGLRQYFADLRSLPAEQQLARLREIPGLGPKESAYVQGQLPLLTDAHIAGGFVDRGPAFKKLIPHVVHTQVIALAKGETDEPVTSDTKRLIRTPGSLHGKSGMRVIVLTRDQLDAFDPLVDAIAFGDEPVDVEVVKPFKTTLKRQEIELTPGRMRLPEYAAVFAVMRGAARPA